MTDTAPSVIVVTDDAGVVVVDLVPDVVAVDVQVDDPVEVIVVDVGTTGPPGDSGTVTSDTPPADTDLLWLDTATEGAPVVQTINVFIYTDEADPRPDATVVFWIPDPFDLPNPFGALEGDCVLRSTPDMLTGLNGVEAIWKGTAAEYDALTPADDTVYFVYEPEAP